MMIKNTDDAVWLVLSSVWAVGGLLSWCYCLLSPDRGSVEASNLAAVAIMVAVVALAIRLPILTGFRTLNSGDSVERQLEVPWAVMLLGLVANGNWAGTLALMSESWQDFWPALLILVLLEAWICSRVFLERALPVPDSIAQFPREKLPWLDSIRHAVAKRSTPELSEFAGEAMTETRGADEAEYLDTSGGSSLNRSLSDGIDDAGNRFLVGTIQSGLEADKMSEQLVVAFCPAFAHVPEIEFEASHEAVELKLVNVTQAGMRLEVRRERSSAAESEVEYEVEWYAVENSRTDSANSPILP